MKPFQTIRSLLVHPKDKRMQQDARECGYIIPCKNCDKTYIKETGRAFDVRLQVHRQEVTQRYVRAYTQSTSKSAATEQNKSAVTDHAISLNHVINWDHAKVIDRESNRMDRCIREAIHFRKRTRQVDEPRRGVLPTSTHLWLLTVRHSNTWWTVVRTKAAAVAETSTKTIIKGCNLMNLL